MPYRRSYKKRAYKKKLVKKDTRTPYQIHGSALVDYLSGQALDKLKSKLGLNTEKHWFDAVETNVATTTTCLPMVTNPTAIPIGDTVNTRTGNSIRITSYVVKGRIQANTAGNGGSFVRVLFVKFKDTRGLQAGLDGTDFLDDPARLTSQYNMGDTASAIGYTVLYDKTFRVSQFGQEGDNHLFFFKYAPTVWHVKWTASDTTGAAGGLMGDSVRGFIFTDATANPPNYWADHRIKFVDN